MIPDLSRWMMAGSPMTLALGVLGIPPGMLPPHANGLDSAITGNNAVPWTIVFTLTLLTLLPAMVLSMTPMVRLLVVFHFLRQALGTQTAPSNQTLMGLGLMMTWFLMQPVLRRRPAGGGAFPAGTDFRIEAIERGSEPPRSTCCATRGKRTLRCLPRRR